MFATLNQLFTSLELTDETLATSALTPQGDAAGGFADLLQLRVDAGLADTELPGEFLPPAGSELPLEALPVELEEGTAPAISSPLLSLQEPLAEGAELELDLLPQQALAGETPLMTAPQEVPVAAAVIKAPDLTTAAADRRDVLTTIGSRPLPVVTTPRTGPQLPVTPPGELVDLPKIESRRPLPAGLLQPVTMSAPTLEERAVPVDMPQRRFDATPLPVTSSEEISEVFKARPTVTQPVQVLGSQPNPQQTFVIPPPSATPVVDGGYQPALQQAVDLISTPVRDAAWGDQIGERVLLLAGNQTKTAEIRLTPAELGPLRVQVSMDDGAANVTFHAQHAATREAIEQALPRLRELLAENGVSLGQANVGEQSEGSGDQETGSLQDTRGASDAHEDAGQDEAETARTTVSTNSLVDTFV